MTQNIKNLLGAAIIIGVLMIGYSAVQYSSAYGKAIQPSSFRNFSVTGEGKVVAVPDVAKFSFVVTTEGGKDLGTLQTDNTTKVNKAIDFVKGKSVDAKDIKTSAYDITPRYQYFNCSTPVVYSQGAPSIGSVRPCPPPEIVGYTVTQSVEVKVRDFTKIGDILSGVVKSGANSVSSLSFTIDDPTKVESEAREKAIKEAQEKAKGIARAGGFRIGRLLGIDEGSSAYPVYEGRGGYDTMSSVKAMSAPAPVIEPGSQDVKITVTLRYEID